MTKRNNRGKRLAIPTQFLEKVAMDIGYGHPDSPGSFKYSLLNVDCKTQYTYIYGIRGITGDGIHNDLLAFFIEAGYTPCTIQCDFDAKFIAGSMRQLTPEWGIILQAAPGGRQSQNSLAESHWKHINKMSRAILVDRGIPKSLWLFALHHAVQLCNYVPIMVDGSMVTSFEPVHNRQPNYQAILYSIFCHRYFRRVIYGKHDRLQLEPPPQPGIIIGCSELANGIMSWKPTTTSILVSANYRLDPF
jgi:hypothetical protein